MVTLLMVLMVSGEPQLQAVTGFQSMKSCELAGKLVEAQWPDENSFACVPSKVPDKTAGKLIRQIDQAIVSARVRRQVEQAEREDAAKHPKYRI